MVVGDTKYTVMKKARQRDDTSEVTEEKTGKGKLPVRESGWKNELPCLFCTVISIASFIVELLYCGGR